MKRSLLLFILGLVLLAGCQPAGELVLRGRILLWHDWSEADTAVLDELLAGFQDLNPEVRVVSLAVPSGTLRQRYEEIATLGLGPDLLILSEADLRPLAGANLIRPLPEPGIRADKFISTALDSLHFQDSQYGLPLSLRPVALYYNAEQVETPARTLEELLREAGNGRAVALNSRFLLSLWGLPAFGGSLFDAEGRVVLNQGGYTNWLNWLKTAQDTPGIILDRNDELLRSLFVSGRAAYYVGGPQALPDLQEQMTDVPLGAVPLPSGPNGPAGPLLQVEAIFFNQASSSHQAELALALADYLTNAEQNAQLMREANRVPANRRVRVDQQAFPVIAGFAAQSRTAVAVPQLPQTEILVTAGEDMLRGVLTGLVDVNEAAFQLAQTVNSQFGLDTPPLTLPVAECDSAGELTVWHAWRGSAAETLSQIAADFMRLCEGAAVQLRQFESDALSVSLTENDADASWPDLILGPSEWTLKLAADDLIAPLDDQVNVAVLQRYVAPALNTVRQDGQLYGLPVKLNLAALYYNGAVVTDPAKTLDDLLNEASAGNEVALPLGFEQAFWGVGAFGSTLFDDSYRLPLVNSGFVSWLTWLQQAQSQPGLTLAVDDAVLQVLFSSGGVVYYAGSSQRLGTLQAALGEDSLRVTNLPAGPGGAAEPLLSTDSLFFYRTVTGANSDLALDFALFLTAVDAQAKLMTQAQIVPTNINVDSSDFPAISGFLAQAQTAVVWPQFPEAEIVRQQGTRLYESVVLRQSPPAPAACEFAIIVNRANGFAVDEAELPNHCDLESGALPDE